MLLKIIQRQWYEGGAWDGPSLYELVRPLTLHGPGTTRTFCMCIGADAATVDVWYPERGWTPLSHIPNKCRGPANTKESIVEERDRLLKIAFEVEYGKPLDVGGIIEQVAESVTENGNGKEG